MKRLGKVFLATGMVALVAAACFSDPTSDLQNGPTRLNLSKRFVVQNVGDTDQVNIQVFDDQGNAQAFESVTYAPVDPTVATMADLPDANLRTVPGNTLFKSILAGLSAGTTKIAVTAGGVTDTLTVLVYPVAFTGPVTPATANVGDTVTIGVPAGITFNTTTANATIGGLPFYAVASRTATQLKLIAGATSAASVVNVTGGILLGTIPLPALNTVATLAVNEPGEPANNAPAGGPAITLPTTTGSSVVRYGAIGTADVDDYFTITTTTADSLEIVFDWPNATIDIDAFILNSAGGGFCVLDGCSAATGADPERIRVRLAAATTYKIYVNLYDNHGVATPHPYRITITKRG